MTGFMEASAIRTVQADMANLNDFILFLSFLKEDDYTHMKVYATRRLFYQILPPRAYANHPKYSRDE